MSHREGQTGVGGREREKEGRRRCDPSKPGFLKKGEEGDRGAGDSHVVKKRKCSVRKELRLRVHSGEVAPATSVPGHSFCYRRKLEHHDLRDIGQCHVKSREALRLF